MNYSSINVYEEYRMENGFKIQGHNLCREMGANYKLFSKSKKKRMDEAKKECVLLSHLNDVFWVKFNYD